MSDAGDVFEFELFKNSLHSLADEMALTVLRTSYSSVLKGSMDYSTAICDAQGRMVAQGLTLPQHLGSIPTALASVLGHCLAPVTGPLWGGNWRQAVAGGSIEG